MSRQRILFLVFTVALCVLYGWAYWSDASKDWVRYQQTFAASFEGDERQQAPHGVQQMVIPKLDRIDRCTTCHVGIERSKMALAEHPFRAHPGDLLEHHPIEKFACTSCHAGQGMATTTAAAHGDVKHWEEPLLRGPLVQASCVACHGPVPNIGAPIAQRGRTLVEEKGCFGCHTIQGFGGTISQDLSDIGVKPYLQIDFTFVQGGHDRAAWIHEKLMNPQHIEPGHPSADPPIAPSAMPNFGLTEEEAQAMTVYLMGLTGEDLPASYVVPIAPQLEPSYATRLAHGQAVFKKFGCNGCHGDQGRGGRRNWNAYTSEEIPPLTYVRDGYDKAALIEFIQRGSPVIPKLLTHGPTPPLYMPAWEGKILPDELEVLAEYLLSLAPPVTPTAPIIPTQPLPAESSAPPAAL